MYSNAPIINRKKMKSLLDSTFDRFFSVFNTELKANVESSGTFCLTFDVWTSVAQTAYLGLIINYLVQGFTNTTEVIGHGA